MQFVFGLDFVGGDDNHRTDVFELHRVDDNLLLDPLAEGFQLDPLLFQRLDHAGAIAELVSDAASDDLLHDAFGQFVVRVGVEVVQDEQAFDQQLDGVISKLADSLFQHLRLVPELRTKQSFRLVHFSFDLLEGDDGVVDPRGDPVDHHRFGPHFGRGEQPQKYQPGRPARE